MTYNKRSDGRGFDELRPIEAKVGVVKSAAGSAMFRIGQTVAVAAVYYPLDLPGGIQNPRTAAFRCNYNMMAFSGSGDRVKPGRSRRSQEIALVMEKALLPLLDLRDYAYTGIDVIVELVQTDAGTRCAAITAASLALADAGIPMKDFVSAVALGRIANKIVVDVNKAEEDYEDGMADIPVAMSARTGEVTLLQADGAFSLAELETVLAKAREACLKIRDVQVQAMLAKYPGGMTHD